MSLASGRGVEHMFLIGIGWMCVVLGTIGIFVPLLPTTCFLLAAGWCFSRSSPRFTRWLHENRLFGAYLEAYGTRGVVPVRVKAVSLAALWTSIGFSLLVISGPVWVDVSLLFIAVAVSWHVGRLPTVEATA